MKYIITLLLTVFLFSCKDKPTLQAAIKEVLSTPKDTPRVAYNQCTNVYAVVTGISHLVNGPAFFGMSYGNAFYRDKSDTCDWAILGYEFKFKDSATAWDTYSKWKRRDEIKDSLSVVAIHAKDSIEKCKKSYKILK